MRRVGIRLGLFGSGFRFGMVFGSGLGSGTGSVPFLDRGFGSVCVSVRDLVRALVRFVFWFGFRFGWILLGAELLRVQMIPVDNISAGIKAGISDHMLADMAGNAFTGSVYSAVLLAALVHAPQPSQPSSSADFDAIASIFDL